MRSFYLFLRIGHKKHTALFKSSAFLGTHPLPTASAHTQSTLNLGSVSGLTYITVLTVSLCCFFFVPLHGSCLAAAELSTGGRSVPRQWGSYPHIGHFASRCKCVHQQQCDQREQGAMIGLLESVRCTGVQDTVGEQHWHWDVCAQHWGRLQYYGPNMEDGAPMC